MATVLHLTDTHIADDPAFALKGVKVRDSLTRVLVDSARHGRPNLLLATGDLSHDGSGTAYRWLADTLIPVAPRLAALAGNHDDPAPLAAILPMPRKVELGGWRILLLHTPVPGMEGGHLADDELAFLDRALAAPAMPTLVALHHPPLALGSRWLDAIGLDNAGDFWRLVEPRRQVRAVLFGHAHQAFDGRRGPVRVLGTPSTCAQFRPHAVEFALDARPPGYRMLTLHADGGLDTAVHYLPRG